MNLRFAFSTVILGLLTLGACGPSVKVGDDGTGGATSATSTGSTTTTSASTSGGGSSSTSTTTSTGTGGVAPGGLGACCGGTIADPPMCSLEFTCVSTGADVGGTCAMAGANISDIGQPCGGTIISPTPMCSCHNRCLEHSPDAGGLCAPLCEKDQDCGTGLCDKAQGICFCTQDAQCLLISSDLICDPTAGNLAQGGLCKVFFK